MFHVCEHLARQCEEHSRELEPFVRRYSEKAPEEPERLHAELFHGTRTGPLGLLRDLQDLCLMAAECDLSWTMIGQAAQGILDRELLAIVNRFEGETVIQLRWLWTRMKEAAARRWWCPNERRTCGLTFRLLWLTGPEPESTLDFGRAEVGTCRQHAPRNHEHRLAGIPRPSRRGAS